MKALKNIPSKKGWKLGQPRTFKNKVLKVFGLYKPKWAQ